MATISGGHQAWVSINAKIIVCGYEQITAIVPTQTRTMFVNNYEEIDYWRLKPASSFAELLQYSYSDGNGQFSTNDTYC